MLNRNLLKVIVLSVWSVCLVQAQSLPGAGTADNPYVIKTKEDLVIMGRYMGDRSTNKFFALGDDIVFDGKDFEQGGAYYNDGQGWIPIGGKADSESGEGFNGTFDGRGYCISGVKCMGTKNGRRAGLFADVFKAKFKNLNLVIHLDLSNPNYAVGGIVANGKGVNFDNCHVQGSIRVKFPEKFYSSDSDFPEPEKRAFVGAFSGYFNRWGCDGNMEVKNCSVQNMTIDVVVEKQEAGTLYVGSFSGASQGQFQFKNCFAKNVTINVTSTDKIIAGGIIGQLGHGRDALMQSVYTMVDFNLKTSGEIRCGGVIGTAYQGCMAQNLISNCSFNLNGGHIMNGGVVGNHYADDVPENFKYLVSVNKMVVANSASPSNIKIAHCIMSNTQPKFNSSLKVYPVSINGQKSNLKPTPDCQNYSMRSPARDELMKLGFSFGIKEDQPWVFDKNVSIPGFYYEDTVTKKMQPFRAMSEIQRSRVWTALSGGKIEGVFVKLEGGNLTIKDKMGQNKIFPAAKLSKEDQSLLKAYLQLSK